MSVSLNNVGARVDQSAPVGAVVAFAGSSAPAGWLLCNGGSYSRSGTYASLYAVLGTTYGNTTSSNFQVPDLRGRVVAGYGNSSILSESTTLGNKTGSQSVSLTATNMVPGSVSLPTMNDDASKSGGSGGYGSVTKNPTLSVSYSGSGGSHENTQPTIILNYIIKY
jgi:microcystin-dependent protein